MPDFASVDWRNQGYGCRANPNCTPPFYRTADERNAHESAEHPTWTPPSLSSAPGWTNYPQQKYALSRRKQQP